MCTSLVFDIPRRVCLWGLVCVCVVVVVAVIVKVFIGSVFMVPACLLSL